MRRLRGLLFAALLAGLGAGSCLTPESSPLEFLGGRSEAFELSMEGNATFEQRALLRQVQQNLQEFVDRDFPKYAVDDAAYGLQAYYQSEGFASAEVDYELTTEGREKPLVRLSITEGPRTRLSEVIFAGNQAFEADDLAKLVLPSAGGLFGQDEVWFARSRLDSGRSRIASLYYERGHLDVEVELGEVRFSEDRTGATVTYRIIEGPQFILREVELSGLPDEWIPVARRSFADNIGKPWYPRVTYEIESKVKDVPADRGHPYASLEVERTVDRASGDVKLRLVVDPGPQIRVGELRVTGNEKTARSFVSSRMVLSTGDIYSRSKQRESFRNLYETGIFNRVRITLEGEEEGLRDLLIDIEEGPSLEVYVEPGYGSYEGPRLLTGITERNLFGTGRRVTAELAVAVLAQKALLRFTEPNFFGPDTNIDVEGFAGRREEPSFTREEIGGAVQLRHRVTRRVSTTVRYERVDTRAIDIQAEDPTTIVEQEDVALSLVSFTPAYDSRNAPFLPASGTLGRFTVQVSDPYIGSELGYVRLLGTFVQYFPSGNEAGFAAAFRTGVLLPTDGADSFPIQLRFFNGGENTVRSFKESQLGPKDDTGQPLGGEVYNVLSMEYRRMLFARLQGALFADAGNVLSNSNEYGQLEGIRMAVGVGLRWILPIGPVRLDWGLNPDRHSGEDSWVLHFSLGTAY